MQYSTYQVLPEWRTLGCRAAAAMRPKGEIWMTAYLEERPLELEVLCDTRVRDATDEKGNYTVFV